MERELWPELYRLVRQLGCEVRQKGVRYQPWVIALVVLWAALHDRPRNWACDSRNWSSAGRKHRPLQLSVTHISFSMHGHRGGAVEVFHSLARG